jgi:hypothetical protein
MPLSKLICQVYNVRVKHRAAPVQQWQQEQRSKMVEDGEREQGLVTNRRAGYYDSRGQSGLTTGMLVLYRTAEAHFEIECYGDREFCTPCGPLPQDLAHRPVSTPRSAFSDHHSVGIKTLNERGLSVSCSESRILSVASLKIVSKTSLGFLRVRSLSALTVRRKSLLPQARLGPPHSL